MFIVVLLCHNFVHTTNAGCINLGTSELRVAYDLISDRLLSGSSVRVPENLTHYFTYDGAASFKQVWSCVIIVVVVIVIAVVVVTLLIVVTLVVMVVVVIIIVVVAVGVVWVL